MYQLPTFYGFQDKAIQNFNDQGHYDVRGPNQDHTMTLNTYTPINNIPTKYQRFTPYGF